VGLFPLPTKKYLFEATPLASICVLKIVRRKTWFRAFSF
ncbi:MAG: hypothetical protein ACI9QN_002165, partial [Arcticibacterium sp.]